MIGVPLGRWETITSWPLGHNNAPMVVEVAMTGDMFLATCRKLLALTLTNEIVAMDNCWVHLEPASAGIETVAATLRYLPKIRPTSIHPRYKFKTLRKVAARRFEALTAPPLLHPAAQS